jgi:hypothetical protein
MRQHVGSNSCRQCKEIVDAGHCGCGEPRGARTRRRTTLLANQLSESRQIRSLGGAQLDPVSGSIRAVIRIPCNNRVADALRMAAESLWHSDSYLGARYRRLRGRMEGEKAIKAMAHYLARLVYRLVTKGREYVDRGVAYYEGQRAQRDLTHLQRKAAELGLKLVPTA